MKLLNLKFLIQSRKPHQISVDEIKIELRKIEEIMFNKIITSEIIKKLKILLENKIIRPYGLKFDIVITNNSLKLYGLDEDAKAVSDLKFDILPIAEAKGFTFVDR